MTVGIVSGGHLDMGKYDGAIIEIVNWDKFNPRKDLKATSWLRLQNSLFDDHNFFEWSHSEVLFWIYILSLASKKQKGEIRFSQSHAERIGRFDRKVIDEAMEKLVELQCITVTLHARNTDVTRTLRARHTTNERTNERNERDETDAATSAPPMLAPELLTESTQEILERTKPEAQKAWLGIYTDHSWIKLELAKAWAWCKSNPSKAPKSDWTRFVNGWLSRGWDNYRKTLPSTHTPQNYATKRQEANQTSLSEYLEHLGRPDEQAG